MDKKQTAHANYLKQRQALWVLEATNLLEWLSTDRTTTEVADYLKDHFLLRKNVVE